MRTRFTSSIEARRRTAIVMLSLLFSVFVGCDDGVTPVAPQECRPNQFRLCDAECGRGVEQCVEPGRWNGCACAVLDAAYVIDAPADRDASDANDASDATDAGEASDDSPADAPVEADEGGEPAEGGDSASNTQSG